MSQTEFKVNDPLANKLWSTDLQVAIPKESWFMQSGFVGKDPSKNIIVIREDLKVKPGDQTTYAIRQQIRGGAVAGDNNLVGKTHAMTYLDDVITINQLRTGVNSGGKMSNKRVPYNVRRDARDAQAEYWGVQTDEEMIIKLSGAVGVGHFENIDPQASGFDVDGAVDADGNELRAPSSNRHIIAGAGLKNALTTADKFSLDAVDKALLLATRIQSNTATRRKMAPLRVKGKNIWICLMDSVQAMDLKAATGGRWYDIEKARLTGGFKDSALVQQSLGAYESAFGTVLFYSHEGMVKFNDYGASANVKAARALLMGQAAGTLAPGNAGEGDLNVVWHEEEANHGNEVIITSGLIRGFQKTAYRTAKGSNVREDYGVMAIDTAAAW